MTDFADQAGKNPVEPTLSDAPDAASAQGEVVYSRRLMIGMLLSSAVATPALAAETVTKGVTPAMRPGQVPITAAQGLANVKRTPFSNLLSDQTDFVMLRTDDLVKLDVRLVNMVVTGPPAARIIRKIDASKGGLMIVGFAPQAIAESTFPDMSGDSDASPTPPAMPNVKRDGTVNGTSSASAYGGIGKTMRAQAFAAGPSRLSFMTPQDFTSINFTVADVLGACNTWRLNLDLKAMAPPDSMITAHDFDAIRVRLSALADKQKAALAKYPATEAVLRRAADRVADAIAVAAGQGYALPDAAIDKLIQYEIDTTVPPVKAGIGDAADLTGYGAPAKAAYVATLSTLNLSRRVSPYTRNTPVDDGASVPMKQNDGQPQMTVISPGALYSIDLHDRPIADTATDIEVPYRLHMSPLATAGFTHEVDAVDHGGDFFELWHTKLGTRVSDWVLGDNPEPLRALWADDMSSDATQAADPVTAGALSGLDRKGIVQLTAGYLKPNFTPLPVMAQHLRLTALGASLDAEGNWPDHLKAGTDIVEWKHVSSIGRDQFVRVIYEGFLFPFGHAASLIKVSERKFSRQSDGGRVAGLMQKFYIIVRQRSRDYPGDQQLYEGRDFPFTKVEILTKQTPDLRAPEEIWELNLYRYGEDTKATPQRKYYGDQEAYQTFWPKLMKDATDMYFPLLGTDSQGRKTKFEMPLIFVSGLRNIAGVPPKSTRTDIDLIVDYYNTDQAIAQKVKVNVDHALIRFCQDRDANGNPLTGKGESDYHASELYFRSSKSMPASGEAPLDGARFYPGLAKADIDLPSFKTLLDTNAPPPSVAYHDRYLAHGFDGTGPGAKNPAEMVFSVVSTIAAVPAKASDRFGGMVSSSMVPDGLSRKLGALTNSANYIDGAFNPKDAIPTDAQLLGAIPLKDILTAVSDFGGDAIKAVPKIKNMVDGASVTATYELVQDKVKPFGDLFLPLDPPPGQPQFKVVTTVTVAKAGQKPDATVDAALLAFKINLFGFIQLNFTKLSMHAQPGMKTKVSVALDDDNGVLFGGPLEFVNSLRDMIPTGGFADGPGLNVTPQGISASYSLGLPDIGIGVLSLSNVSLGAGFDLSFAGAPPSVKFNFAERHNPFNLTVSLFGGGGFFAITLDTGGVRELEASLEFGAQISINLGVASGGVYVKGGFYFHWIGSPKDQQLVQFEGYVELGGHLSVLGLITVSLTFHLGLTYEKAGGHSKLYGTATLTVEIDILFFSISQDVTVEKEFAGSDADPSFIDFVPTDKVWSDYCNAFA